MYLPILKLSVDLADPLLILPIFVKIIVGLLKYSLILEAIIPIKPFVYIIQIQNYYAVITSL